MRINYKQIFGLYINLLDMRYGIKKFLDMKGRRLTKLKKEHKYCKICIRLLCTEYSQNIL